MSKIDIRRRFLELAYKQLHPDLTTLDGLEQALKNWYCFQYNVPPNDDKLLDMTVEELLVLNQMHKLRAEPALAEEIGGAANEYEEWLKKEMGDGYVSIEDMVANAELQEEAERKEIEDLAKDLPSVITTDFSKGE